MNDLQYALAAEIHGEMKAQRMTATEIQRRTGIKPASWTNWFVGFKRPVAMSTVILVADALGLSTSELLRRAEVRAAHTPPRDDDDLTEGLRPSERAELDRVRKPGKAEPPASSEQTSRVG